MFDSLINVCFMHVENIPHTCETLSKTQDTKECQIEISPARFH